MLLVAVCSIGCAPSSATRLEPLGLYGATFDGARGQRRILALVSPS